MNKLSTLLREMETRTLHAYQEWVANVVRREPSASINNPVISHTTEVYFEEREGRHVSLEVFLAYMKTHDGHFLVTPNQKVLDLIASFNKPQQS